MVQTLSSSRVRGVIRDKDWLGSVEGWFLTEMGPKPFEWNWGKWLVGSFKIDQYMQKKWLTRV